MPKKGRSLKRFMQNKLFMIIVVILNVMLVVFLINAARIIAYCRDSKLQNCLWLYIYI